MQRLLYPSAVLALFGGWIASGPSPAAPPEGKGAAPDRPRYVIQPGVGIEGLKLGMARKEAADFLKVTDFGKADERLYSRDLGLRVDFNKEGRAIQLQFIYRKTTWPFDGVTDKGVGKWCTVHDVIRGYGPPDSASDARNEKVPVLRYAASGIEFYFNEHGELTIVQVWAPEKPPGKK